MGPRRRKPKAEKDLQRSRWREADEPQVTTTDPGIGFSATGGAESSSRAGVLSFATGC
jgi:hypothetical protein